MTVTDFLNHLAGVKANTNGWVARCPGHDDNHASLSIGVGEQGRILLHCHAGCPNVNILSALGLSMEDLFPSRSDPGSRQRIVATYDYSDEDGRLLYQCVRFDPKSFRQRRPDPAMPGEWIWNVSSIRRVLYRLPEVIPAVKAGRTVLIAEGEKDVDALIKNGFAATCNAMGAGKWLPEHAKTLRDAARVVVIADKDQPGRRHAQTVATSLSGVAKSVRLIELPDRDGCPVKDAADWFAAGGTAEELRTIVKAAPEFVAKPEPRQDRAETIEETLARLAALSVADYESCRKGEADKLNMRLSALDNEVKAWRPQKDTAQGVRMEFMDLELWPAPVSGAELLDEILKVLRRYVVASAAALISCALYALHSYAFDLGDISPMLFITGPTKRCGKSRLLSVLARLVHRPLSASSASAAGIYRTIELHRPTLLIDEVDAFLKGDDQLRGLINSGHTRDAAFHLGCVTVGDDIQPRRWSTWAPKIFSGIGRLADTIEDRAIKVQMRRRRKQEAAERLRYCTRFDDLRRKSARFVSDHAEGIRAAEPAIPEALNDRAADNWLPLLALADLVGGDWPAKARQAALELSGTDDTETLGTNAQLLADIQRIFEEAGDDRMASKELCERLVAFEGRPWAEFGWNRKPISPNNLANLLREFGISPHGVRIGENTPKGYLLDDFSDAFSRYLPGNGLSKRNTATECTGTDEKSLFGSATPEACCVSENAIPACGEAGVAVLRIEMPQLVRRRFMSDPKDILNRARSLGLTVCREGTRLAIAPARLCPADLLAALKVHKQAVMDLMEAEAGNITPDCAPWFHIARQVLAGEFRGADRSLAESLSIGLRAIRHPLCQQALAHLGQSLRGTGCANNQ